MAVAMLSLEIGDRILYKDTAMGIASAQLNDRWYVESITYQAGVNRITGIEVSLVPSYAYRDLAHIAYDLFTRPNTATLLGQALSGQTWSGDSNFRILSNRARPISTAEQIPTLALGAADCVVEADILGITGAGTEVVGLVYRHADASNYWRAVLSTVAGAILALQKVVVGTPTTVGSVAFTPAASHELRVMVQGTRHRVWLDRKLMIDATDAALQSNTRVGLYSTGAGATSDDFDDIAAQGL